MNEPFPSGISRRAFLGATAAATAFTVAAAAHPAPDTLTFATRVEGLIDVNVSLFRWPARRLPCDDTTALVSKLRHHGVTEAWAGSFEGLLHKDLTGVNRRLNHECAAHGKGLLRPFGSVNPKQPDWEEELRRCKEVYCMPGIRLHPNYHGYSLDDADFARLLRLAAEACLIVQLVVIMEDERTVHPRLWLDPINLGPLTGLVSQTPGLKLVLLNSLRSWRGERLQRLLSEGEVCVEIAMLEGVGGVARLLKEVPAERVLFGSHAPFYYFESAMLKLQESAVIGEQLNSIRAKNARRLFMKNAGQ